jgi:hypothetical protein
MLQPRVLERWSQVTIYAKPSRCNIGLSHEGFHDVRKPAFGKSPWPSSAV